MVLLNDVFIPVSNQWVRRDVVIDRGLFRTVTEPGAMGKRSDLKTEGLYLMPAWVDPHVHVRDPGYTYKEDWYSCSRAALKGGYATILDMPNNKVPTTDVDTLKNKMEIAKSRSYVNFGLHIALTDHNAEELRDRWIQSRVCGIKVYMARTTGGITVSSERALLDVFRQPRPVMVHTGGMEGLSRILFIHERAAKSFPHLPVLYICHVSTENELKLLRKKKGKLPHIRAEVTPHHLFLDKAGYHGPPGVLPPLGSERDREALWEGVGDGLIEFLGTDHAPHTREEKMSDNPPAGFPGLETSLPLMMNALAEGRIGPDRLLAIASRNARLLFRMGKGAGVQKNEPADCVLLERGEFTVGEGGYETKCGWSPFHGWKYSFRPVITIVNGAIAFNRGGFIKTSVKMMCGA
jgi:dihydroorotase